MIKVVQLSFKLKDRTYSVYGYIKESEKLVNNDEQGGASLHPLLYPPPPWDVVKWVRRNQTNCGVMTLTFTKLRSLTNYLLFWPLRYVKKNVIYRNSYSKIIFSWIHTRWKELVSSLYSDSNVRLIEFCNICL